MLTTSAVANVPADLLADGPAFLTINVRIEDKDGGFTDYQTTIEIVNDAPALNLIGPGSGLSGQTLDYTLLASDFSPVRQAADFILEIDWGGDGEVDETVSGLSPYTIEHAFEDPGATSVIVTATDKDSSVSDPAIHTMNVIQPVDIDVKAGGDGHPINVSSNG